MVCTITARSLPPAGIPICITPPVEINADHITHDTKHDHMVAGGAHHVKQPTGPLSADAYFALFSYSTQRASRELRPASQSTKCK